MSYYLTGGGSNYVGGSMSLGYCICGFCNESNRPEKLVDRIFSLTKKIRNLATLSNQLKNR